MIEGDTIVACSSAPGWSARALVRCSGPGTRGIFESLTPSRFGGPGGTGRGAFLGRVELTPGLELAVLVLWFPAPGSFTGEDVLEILMPGNPGLVERVVARLGERAGVRAALGGEFSARAYLNGRLTLEQGEGVAALLAATRDEDLDVARDLASGTTGERYRELRDELVGLVALVEAGIDFTDQEDVVPIAPRELRDRLGRVVAGIDRLRGGSGRVEHALGVVALVGRASAGKSTLFNALLGRRRAATSPTPGTTRDALDEEMELVPGAPLGTRVVLRDTPGLEEDAPGPSARAAQDASRESASRADVLLWCDPAGQFGAAGGEPDDARTIRVRTFADRPANGRREHVAVCALTGQGLAELRRLIGERLVRARSATASSLLARHSAGLARARAELARVIDGIAPTDRTLGSPELVAEGIRAGVGALGELGGRVEVDEVLAKVFASFCVGK